MLTILPPNPLWPAEFQALAVALRQALGPLALRIDHIGSTAVPGLAAKDIIDIQITVAALDERIAAALAPVGYTLGAGVWRDHRPPHANWADADGEKFYFRPPPGQRRTHMHVRVQGRANQRYALLFRDYLRAQPPMAEAYAELKRRLAQALRDPADYPEVKDPAVDLIYFAAEAWAAQTGWQPGASDA